jgi:hypothetical protein
VHPNESLKDAVDIWTPNIGDSFGLGHLDLQMLAAERKKGRETWWYTMVEPKIPYPTWLVDDDAAAVRVYGWMMAQYGITGFVYSMAHGWGPKPLENIQSFAGTNGDGTLLYPSELVGGSGPMPSIRLMLLRDAIEDYELLQMLDPEAIALFTDWTPTVPHLFMNPPETQSSLFVDLRDRMLGLLSGRHKFLWFAPIPVRPIIFPQKPRDDTVTIGNPYAPNAYTIPRAVAPQVDGNIREGEWDKRHSVEGDLHRFDMDRAKLPSTTLFVAHDKNNLYVAMRCRFDTSTQGEWVAVDLAPLDAQERWRFVLTQKGNRVVERHTREGQFRVEGVDWTAAQQRFNSYYDVEMRIPLSALGDATKFRFNALRRTTHAPTGTRIVLRAWSDAGDVYLMPIATLSSDGLKSKQKRSSRQRHEYSTNRLQTRHNGKGHADDI